MKTKRNSNFELMRIISMLMIVFWHFIIHSGIWNNTYGLSKVIFIVLSAIVYVHVNSFVLLSGYFQSNEELKLSKVIKLNNSVWFYSSIILILFLLFGTYKFSKVYILQTLLPVSFNDYWFFTNFIVIYLISPILNKTIQNTNQKQFIKILITLALVFSILPFLTLESSFNVMGGYSLYSFILLYFIGAYFRKYPLNKLNKIKKISIKNRRIILIFIIILCICINSMCYLFSNKLVENNSNLIKTISLIFNNGFLSYSNPILVFQSICYFLFFMTFKFENKIINKISSCTFGVYLISDNNLVRKWLYKFLGFTKETYSFKTVFYVLLCTILVFIICIIIEAIRQHIFKKIYNSKLANKNRIWYRKYIDKLGLDINW